VLGALFSTTALPGGDGRRPLPGGHHERVVPGRDLRDHAERLAAQEGRVPGRVLAGGQRLRDAGGAGAEADDVEHVRHLGAHRLARLAGVAALRLDEVLRARLEQVREPEQRR
jgi:hypothetical protein